MANRVRGEASLKAGARTFRVVLDANALCEAEEALGLGAAGLAALQAGMGFRAMRGLLWAGLQRHHPDISLIAAGDLLDEAGPKAVGDLLAATLTAAFPKDDAKAEAGAADARP